MPIFDLMTIFFCILEVTSDESLEGRMLRRPDLDYHQH